MNINKYIKRSEEEAQLTIPVNKKFHTDGNGRWSKVAKSVHVRRIEMTIGLVKDEDGYYNGSDMRVFFTKNAWDINKYGLIYTDVTFIEHLRAFLMEFGFDRAAVEKIRYSEQGMQGELSVSCDAYEFEDYVRALL
ncbi:hypothetical protein PBCVCVG1_516R [Paramecium bursaria Chlorella virus CVG-1]|nr:hypothetical protein PBCVCVG1_516R [Paramecium bursaria Chlorella virus CVG-1]